MGRDSIAATGSEGVRTGPASASAGTPTGLRATTSGTAPSPRTPAFITITGLIPRPRVGRSASRITWGPSFISGRASTPVSTDRTEHRSLVFIGHPAGPGCVVIGSTSVDPLVASFGGPSSAGPASPSPT